jgi:hypothetical protein
MSIGKPGRTRIKLAKMLTELLGRPVNPTDIWDNNYPEARMVDAARWGAYLPGGHIHSWDTMGDCVKKGIEASPRSGGEMEISAKG